jgi:hypothetical protein
VTIGGESLANPGGVSDAFRRCKQRPSKRTVFLSQLSVKVNIQFVSAIFDINVLILVEIAQHA